MKEKRKSTLEQVSDHLKHIVPPDIYPQVMDAMQTTKPTTIRANHLKMDPIELCQLLTASGISFTKVSWYKDAFIINAMPLKILTELPAYTAGQFYVQSLSSMIPPLVLGPQPDERTLDIAAAPGSKTTQIAALMDNTGSIVANDNSQIRLYKLSANLARQGVTNTHVHRGAGQTIWQLYPEYFDRVLADVPCSMEGRINLNDPDTYKDWSHKKVKELAQIQKFLLRAAVSSCKPGGTIVYSTCTLSPEENEGVIDWLLKKEPGKVAIERIDIQGLPGVDGLAEWNEKKYDKEVIKCRRIWPTTQLEGFFVAKIRKLDHTVPLLARSDEALE